MYITLSTRQLRPATMAAMIADLLDNPSDNRLALKGLVKQLKADVGDEMAIDLIIDAGVPPDAFEGVYA